MSLVFRPKPVAPRFATHDAKGQHWHANNAHERLRHVQQGLLPCRDSAETYSFQQNGNTKNRMTTRNSAIFHPVTLLQPPGGVSHASSRTCRKKAKNGVKTAFHLSEHTLFIVFFRQCSGRPVRRTYIYLAVGQPSARICRARRSARPNGRHGRCAKPYEKSFPRGGSPYVQDYRY